MAFRRRGKKAAISLPGCRPSPTNGLPVVASGVASLDSLLGGGIHVGSALVVEEDEFGSYSRILLNTFTAEGAVSSHSVFVASASENPTEILENLPGLVSGVQTSGAATDSNGGSVAMGNIPEEGDEESESLKIAWRYEKQPVAAGSASMQPNHFSHAFDLSQRLELPCDMKCDVFDGLECRDQSSYISLLHRLDAFVEKHALQTGSSGVMRISLHSLGSPLWSGSSSADPMESGRELLQFLHAFQVRLRSWSAVALITVPSHLWTGSPLMQRVRQLSDYVVHVESFAGSSKQQNSLYKDYHGLFHVHKLPCWQGLAPIPLDSTKWAFKLHRKRFSVVKMHLPPDLSETVSRSQEDPVKPRRPAVTCSSAQGPKKRTAAPSLDF